MSVDKSPSARPAEADDTARAARRLVRTALKGSLATLDRETGHPYASLILVATEPNGAPIFLISRLALHTRNLEKDSRASVLIDGTGGLGDPLTGGRLTLSGLARPSASSTGLRRFLARHPSAEGYASFADFSIYALEVAGGHYIGGFGRIVDLSPTALLTSTDDAGAVIDAEPDIVAHMNADHADAVALYATMLAGAGAGAGAGDWRMTGIDPDGADLLHCTSAARIDFPSRVRTPGEARAMLVSQVQQARSRPPAAG
jgi:putative heme iron utilization protein